MSDLAQSQTDPGGQSWLQPETSHRGGYSREDTASYAPAYYCVNYAEAQDTSDNSE